MDLVYGDDRPLSSRSLTVVSFPILTPLPLHRKSFDNLEHWRTDFLHNASPPDPDNFPFIVLGNKADMEADRKVPKHKALTWTKSKGPKPLPYFETSAKDATRVEAAFLEAAQLALEQVSQEKDE